MATEEAPGIPSAPTTYNLLFVCTGNTCRSPMAMGIARRAVEERGWSHVAVDSAGIAALPGSPASEHAIRVAAEHDIDISAHMSRPLLPELAEWADLTLVMNPSHLTALESLGFEEQTALVTDFLDGEGWGEPVEDPFGEDEESYRRAFEQLEHAIDGVLDRLEPILAP